MALLEGVLDLDLAEGAKTWMFCIALRETSRVVVGGSEDSEVWPEDLTVSIRARMDDCRSRVKTVPSNVSLRQVVTLTLNFQSARFDE